MLIPRAQRINRAYDGRTLINTGLIASLVIRNVADPIGEHIFGGAKHDAGEMPAKGGDQGKFLMFPDETDSKYRNGFARSCDRVPV